MSAAAKGYTPGPWHFGPSLNAPGQFFIGQPRHNLTLAHVHNFSDGQREANARLIAAAPDLLEAVHDLSAFVAVMIGRGPDAIIPETQTTPLGVPVKIGEIMRDARAAIAKATGEGG